MDDLMENANKLADKVKKEDKSWWIFTFGVGQQHAGRYVKIFGTFMSARKKMFELYGKEWAFQYSEDEWSEWVKKTPPFMVETLLKEINEDE